MALPVVERSGRDGVAWRPVSNIERFPYDGFVYGLSVPPHHTYIADGIVTHNCIYGFTGAQPEAILHPDIPEDHKIVLKQSYRVPRSVHALAERTIRQVTIRQEKVYLPRPEDGHVSKLAAGGYNSTEYGILKTAEEHMAQGRTVMFLASCSYMLKPLIQVLRKHGIPFHNPYRRSNGFWNPIRLGKPTSTPHRILALLVAHRDFGEYHRPWTQGDVAMWADWLASKGLLRHGAKKTLQQADTEREAGLEYLDRIFESGALDALMEAWEGDYRGLLQWWRDRLTADAVKRSKFPAQIAARYGPQALMETPKIVVGTIHSVKGGQSDCSPPEEPVLSTRGYVPIGDLDPAIHRLVSYTAHTDKIRRGIVRNAGKRDQEGYAFRKACRSYCGDLLTISTASSKTRVTPNHHLIVRWAESAKSKFVVYLMKRGDWWRVGQCRLFYGDRCQFGLGNRAKREGADCAWILSVHDTRADATFHEALTSSRYGIPMLCFNVDRHQRRLSQEELSAVHERLRGFTQGKAEELLFQRGRDPSYPIYKFTSGAPGNADRVGPQNRFVTRASNLIPGLMEVPVIADGIRPNWEPITIEQTHYEGLVYSLDVNPYHYYISGGAVVHNCVYLFPDLSRAGDEQYQRMGAPRDSVVRLFYVGITRARETLYICQPESHRAVSI